MYISLLSALGEHVSETAQYSVEVERWSAATADMFLAWLEAQVR